MSMQSVMNMIPIQSASSAPLCPDHLVPFLRTKQLLIPRLSEIDGLQEAAIFEIKPGGNFDWEPEAGDALFKTALDRFDLVLYDATPRRTS
mmetsp:Transcript_1381/g.4919  ORF Transcript_1381/g.4919 Transcript_1381/m.4919 type:complete len:91 (+) Transcript_1381:263-535(+)